jgi:hypothetical protein
MSSWKMGDQLAGEGEQLLDRGAAARWGNIWQVEMRSWKIAGR